MPICNIKHAQNCERNADGNLKQTQNWQECTIVSDRLGANLKKILNNESYAMNQWETN